MNYPLIDIHDAENTKERILLTAVRMFSENGYAAVSIRDIAAAVEIKPASIYHHFASKEALFDAIVETIEKVYLDFYTRLDRRYAIAKCFSDILDSLFAELKDVYHMFIYYGVSLIATEQFHNEKARIAFDTIYMKLGIDRAAEIFDECVKRKWVKPFHTRGLATFMMNNIFAGSLARVQQDLGRETVYDPTEMFVNLQQCILNSVEILL